MIKTLSIQEHGMNMLIYIYLKLDNIQIQKKNIQKLIIIHIL